MKNCFFFDMDGTLYNRKFHEVSSNTIEALNILKNNGHMVCLASSRCLDELKHLPLNIREFPFDVMILDGGAYILDEQKNTLEEHPIDPSIVLSFDAFCKENDLTYRYSTKEHNYWGTKSDLFWHNLWMMLYLSTPVYKQYENEKAMSLFVRFQNSEHEKRIQEIGKDCGMVRYIDCYEVRANGFNKAKAIQRIKEQYEIDQIYCFGDGDNDIEMIECADVGIAMGNARDVLKKVADIVIDTIDNEGIYKYLLENNMLEEV